MSFILAKQALTASGWQENVRLEIAPNGRIKSVEANVDLKLEQGSNANDVVVGILLPSPANLHSHSFQRAMAGLAEQRSSKSNDSFWTWRETMYRLVDQLDPQDIESIAAFVQMEMLEAGYCAVAEFHYCHHQAGGKPYDNIAETSASIISAASETGIGLRLLPVLYQQGGCDGRKLNSSQLRFYNNNDQFERLIEQAGSAISSLEDDSQIAIAAHSLRAVSPENLKFAASLLPQAPFHLHIAEQQAEVDEVVAIYGQRPVLWLLNNFAVDERWCLVHATQVTPDEVSLLASSHSVVGLCPITESSLGDGIFPGRKFLDENGAFGIGSDSNIRISLAEELRTLEYSQRLQDHRRVILASPEFSTGRVLFEQAAIGGARAAGRNSGEISVGKLADLVALDADAIDLIDKLGDAILDSFIFTGDNTMVTDVWSAGRHVVQQGQHINRHKIINRYIKTLKLLKEKF